MKKHAYLIMAHNNWKILEKLLILLDDKRNDIYLHIDLKLYLANLHTSFLCNLIYPTFSRILLYSC